MVKPHGTRTWLNVPEWLVTEWKTGKKDDMADVLRDCNFDKDELGYSESRMHICLQPRTINQL